MMIQNLWIVRLLVMNISINLPTMRVVLKILIQRVWLAANVESKVCFFMFKDEKFLSQGFSMEFNYERMVQFVRAVYTCFVNSKYYPTAFFHSAPWLFSLNSFGQKVDQTS